MDFDYLRLISLDERESGKLSSISINTFDMARDYLAELYDEAKSIDHFMTERGSELINEIESVQSVLQTIIDQRFKKIIKLAENQIGSGKIDKEELKMLIPVEREMFDEILSAIGECRDKITGVCIQPSNESSKAHLSKKMKSALNSADEVTMFPESDEAICRDIREIPASQSTDNLEDDFEYGIVYIKENMDSFMGLDGHIYSLSAEDVVSLPLQNASVLYGRNIALNIRVSK
ncbi:MAG: DNA replication complex GINS family protein [Methanomicrobiaceae archaeon]|nr:DNA replication complex GINS family protein [Methanomicrobiaceae archaeon]